MGRSSLHDLLLLSLFFTLLLATSASTKECNETDHGHDSEGSCCLKNLLDEEDGKTTCFKEPSPKSVAVAFTLIGSFTFLISLNFAMNWPDPEMKKYAYKVISNTVSIFCAVLMFQCIDGLVEEFIMEPLHMTHWRQFAVDFCHMLLWFIIMQVVLARASGVLKSEDVRSRLLDPKIYEKLEVDKAKDQVQINCNCYGGVVAHLTGFAAINTWTSLQQQEPFNTNAWMALSPLVPATLCQITIQWITAGCREKISMSGDSIKDWFEKQWEEVCSEAEDDVLALTLSVIVANVLRMLINGMVPAGVNCLPNEEQEEEGEACAFIEEGHRTLLQVGCLFLASYLLVFALFVTKLIHEKFFAEEEGSEDGAEENEKPFWAEIVERYTDIFMLMLSMAFSWCIFHANGQLLKAISPTFLGSEDNNCTLAVVLALEVTYIAWIMIKVMDFLYDLDDRYTPKAVDDAIQAVIDATALFIGFAWEQTFDVSVDSLARSFRRDFGKHAPATAKFIIGTLCCSVIFLAWKWYILPFVVKEGWRFHFVFSTADLHSVAHEVAEVDPEFREDILPVLQNKYGALGKYKVLPGKEKEEDRPRFSLQHSKSLHHRLHEAESENAKLLADNAKLKALLNHSMQNMLGSLKALHETADNQVRGEYSST